jgi:hypothetical protein
MLRLPFFCCGVDTSGERRAVCHIIAASFPPKSHADVKGLLRNRLIVAPPTRCEVPMLFQLVQIETDAEGQVVATTPTQPLFELHQHAAAMAEFAAARCGAEYGYDADNDRWWTRDLDGRILLFVVKSVPAPHFDAAA